MRTLHLKSGHETRIRNGHRWAFAGEINEPLKGLEPGDPVALCEARGALLGRGYVNPHSLIAVRLLTSGDEPWDDGLIHRRVESAYRYRQIQNPKSKNHNDDACRLIYSESDALPGLIVDRFADQLVVQSLTAGIERRLDEIVTALVDLLHPAGIFLKGKNPFRKLEGLPEEDRQLFGETPGAVEFGDGGARFSAYPREGQKSGYFLDQRSNRKLLAPFVQGKRLLDLFSYTGGWSITALLAGAAGATLVDTSKRAIEWGMHDAELNGVASKALFVEADVEEFLKESAAAGKQWDVVVVDPPALIPNRQAVPKGIGAYLALNRAALRVVAPGGMLGTCSCSHLLTREKHLEILGRAASQEGRRLRIVAVGGHSPDHPILPGHPETEYLKCWILEVE